VGKRLFSQLPRTKNKRRKRVIEPVLRRYPLQPLAASPETAKKSSQFPHASTEAARASLQFIYRLDLPA
jgi:hypothetical protein